MFKSPKSLIQLSLSVLVWSVAQIAFSTVAQAEVQTYKAKKLAEITSPLKVDQTGTYLSALIVVRHIAPVLRRWKVSDGKLLEYPSLQLNNYVAGGSDIVSNNEILLVTPNGKTFLFLQTPADTFIVQVGVDGTLTQVLSHIDGQEEDYNRSNAKIIVVKSPPPASNGECRNDNPCYLTGEQKVYLLGDGFTGLIDTSPVIYRDNGNSQRPFIYAGTISTNLLATDSDGNTFVLLRRFSALSPSESWDFKSKLLNIALDGKKVSSDIIDSSLDKVTELSNSSYLEAVLITKNILAVQNQERETAETIFLRRDNGLLVGESELSSAEREALEYRLEGIKLRTDKGLRRIECGISNKISWANEVSELLGQREDGTLLVVTQDGSKSWLGLLTPQSFKGYNNGYCVLVKPSFSNQCAGYRSKSVWSMPNWGIGVEGVSAKNILSSDRYFPGNNRSGRIRSLTRLNCGINAQIISPSTGDLVRIGIKVDPYGTPVDGKKIVRALYDKRRNFKLSLQVPGDLSCDYPRVIHLIAEDQNLRVPLMLLGGGDTSVCNHY